MADKNLGFLILGANPPPRGGVAVYLERKVASLRSRGESVQWVNPRHIFSFILALLRLRCFRPRPVAELHTAHPIAIALSCLFFVEPFVTFFDHNYSSGFASRGYFSRLLLSRFLRRDGKVVLVGEHLRNNYADIVSNGVVDRFDVEIPYFSPTKSSVGLDAGILNFKSKYDVVVVNAAWKLAIDGNGNDIYGVEWSLESFLRLYKNSSRVGFLAIVGNDEGERFDRLKALVRSISNVLLITGEHNLCSVICEGNVLLLRTTNTDGDSLSVREAIEFGVPVIASDVVNRPQGTILYKARARDDFEKALSDQIDKILAVPAR